MKVLSLFDGISCGQIALERIGIKIDEYYASEIKAKAIEVTQEHYPKTIQIGDVCKVSYKDGILYTTTSTISLPTYSDGNGLGIGCFHYYYGNIYPYYGSLNDFRIYDHCLSPKEVKEIAKGLVLHYPLNDRYIENTTNLFGNISTS